MFDDIHPIANPPKFIIRVVPFNDIREKALRYCEQRLLLKISDCGNPNDYRTHGILIAKTIIKPSKTANL